LRIILPYSFRRAWARFCFLTTLAWNSSMIARSCGLSWRIAQPTIPPPRTTGLLG